MYLIVFYCCPMHWSSGAWSSFFRKRGSKERFFLSTFLVFIQAAIINRLFIKQSMIGEINLFPGLCYVLLTSLHPSFIGISSLLLANTTMLIAFGYLFDVLKRIGRKKPGLWPVGGSPYPGSCIHLILPSSFLACWR